MDKTERTKQFFDRAAEGWDRSCLHDPEKLDAIVTLADIRKGARVADIGCGTGALFEEILSREPAELLGVDLSDRMIAAARKKFHDGRLRLLAADLFDVAETGFDAATIYSAYPHFPDKERLARKIADMLVEGGRVMVAHSQGKEMINARHRGPEMEQISSPLLPAEQEANHFRKWFQIDILVDTPQLYLISGTKK